MDILFARGKHLQAAPVKLVYLVTETELKFSAQAMFVVPKRQFKKAHDRNKLKRRMKESYRLNKNNFYEKLLAKEKKVVLAFIFTGRKLEDYRIIDAAIRKLCDSLAL